MFTFGSLFAFLFLVPSEHEHNQTAHVRSQLEWMKDDSKNEYFYIFPTNGHSTGHAESKNHRCDSSEPRIIQEINRGLEGIPEERKHRVQVCLDRWEEATTKPRSERILANKKDSESLVGSLDTHMDQHNKETDSKPAYVISFLALARGSAHVEVLINIEMLPSICCTLLRYFSITTCSAHSLVQSLAQCVSSSACRKTKTTLWRNVKLFLCFVWVSVYSVWTL